MLKDFSMGSKRENAKQVTVKVTPLKVIIFFFVLICLGVGVTKLLEPTIKEMYPNEMAIGCVNGSKEVVEFGKEFYCGDHFSVLENTKDYKKLQSIIYGVDLE